MLDALAACSSEPASRSPSRVSTATPARAQRPVLSEHAVTAQTVTGTTITVEYYRPLARGRDSLFGKVVKWGAHWTPGANWATTIEVDRDIRLNSAPLPKGRYAVWAFVEPDRWTLGLRRTWHKFHVPAPRDSGERPWSIRSPTWLRLTLSRPRCMSAWGNRSRPASTTGSSCSYGRIVIPS